MPPKVSQDRVSDDRRMPAEAPASCSDGDLVMGLGALFPLLGSDRFQNLALILKFALKQLKGQFVVYRQFDFERQQILISHEVSSPEGFRRSHGLKGCICHEAFVIEKQPHLIIKDLSQTPYWDSDPVLQRYNLKSYLGCPVVVSGKVVGALAIFDQKPEIFGVRHAHFLQLLGNLIALGEQHRQVEKNLANKLRREKMLSEISASAVSNMEMEKFLALWVKRLGLFLAADGVALLHPKVESPTLKDTVYWRAGNEPGTNFHLVIADLLNLPKVGDVVKKGRIFRCDAPDMLADAKLGDILKAHEIDLLLLIPLFNMKIFYGCCAIYLRKSLPQWSEEDIVASREAVNILAQRLNSHSVAHRLDESEALNYQLFQLSPAAIYRIDLVNLRLLAVNDYLCHASGYTREELLAIRPEDMLTPKSLELFVERLQDISEGKPVSELEEFEVVTKEGNVEWGRFHIQHLYEEGRVVGANVVAHFITEQRRIREALNGYRKNLESMVAARVADLAKANEALRNEIKQHVQTTEKLEASSERLKEMNTAMRVLLDKRIEDHQRTEELIRLNLKELIDPYLTRLENGDLKGAQRQLVDLIRLNLDEVVTSSMPEFASKYFMFSPNELQVVNLIRKGKTSKEIARLLNLSTRTVESYRNSIRKKLGLKRKKVNLRTYLSSI